jgi:hypothetical protein
VIESRNDTLLVKRRALFSDCERYRYLLDIVWDESLPLAVVIGLNPSTADAFQDDPTVRRWVSFAQGWGCGGVRVLNLFAWRATDPAAMKAAVAPMGADNCLWKLMEGATGPVVACWGTHGAHQGRGKMMAAILKNLQCLGRNADGSPRHPLYLRSDTELEPYGQSV